MFLLHTTILGNTTALLETKRNLPLIKNANLIIKSAGGRVELTDKNGEKFNVHCRYMKIVHMVFVFTI